MIRASGRWLRRLAVPVMALVVIGVLGAGLLVWRLAQGPLVLDPLARLIERHAAETGLVGRLAIGEAALVWEGFDEAVDRPLDLRLRAVRALAPDGTVLAEIPEGSVSLGLRALLLGRIMPRAIELRGLSLTLRRAGDGSVAIDLGAEEAPGDPAQDETRLAAAALAALGRPAEHGGWIGALQRLRIRDAVLVVEDRQLGATWRVPDADLDLRRDAGRVAVSLDGAAVAGADTRFSRTGVGVFAPGTPLATDAG
ncbi:hypothetical protein FK498_17190, partial [Elioraea sp. Yellowstone]